MLFKTAAPSFRNVRGAEIRSRLIQLALTSTLALVNGVAQTRVATFTYQEALGVSSQEQNLHFSKTDVGTQILSNLGYEKNRVLDGAGREVAWQKMSNGDFVVRSAVPKSLFPSATTSNFDQLNPDGSMRVSNIPCPAPNTVVSFVALPGGVLPGGADPTTDYFVIDCHNISGGYWAWLLSGAYNGNAVRFSSIGRGWFLQLKAAKFSQQSVYASGHPYVEGDTIMFDTVDGKSLPGGVVRDAIYFVCNPGADTFQISAAPNCENIIQNMSDAAGLVEVLSTKQWTLQSGIATSILPIHAPALGVNGNYWELSNGLLGIRIPTENFQTANNYALAPIQEIQLADGSWTSPAGNVSYDWQTNTNGGHTTPNGYSVSIVEQGLLETDVKITIQADRTFSFYGGGTKLTVDPAFSMLRGSVAIAPYAFYVSSSTISSLPVGVYYVVGRGAGEIAVAGTTGGAPIALSEGEASVFWLTQEPGPGYLTTFVRMSANTPAVLVEESHTVNQYYWQLNFRPALVADTARWRGTNAPTNFNCGYKPLQVTGLSLFGSTLTIESPSHGLSTNATIRLHGTSGIANANDRPFTVTVLAPDRFTVDCPDCSGITGSGGVIESLANISAGYEDVYVDLLGVDRPSSYVCNSSLIRWIGSQYEPNNQGQTGRYWMWYNSSEPSTGNAMGLFLGRGSWQKYGEIFHGPGFFDTPSKGQQGIAVYSAGRGAADNYYTGEMRKSWGIWVGTKADILDPSVFQSIQIVRNALAGINVAKFSRDYSLSYDDPPSGWPYLYESPAGIQQLKDEYQDGTALCGSSDCLSRAVTTNDALQGPTIKFLSSDSSWATAEQAVQPLNSYITTWADVLFNQNGNLDPNLHYYQGLYTCIRDSSLANLIIKSANSSPWHKSRAKAFIAMCGSIAWDSDYFSDDPSISGGLGNQQSQFLQIKSQLAIQAYTNPYLSQVASAAKANTVNNVFSSIGQNGVGYASWHYEGAAIEEGLFGLLNLKNNGQFDPAAYPVLSNFGQWYLSGLTPPEVRFGKNRMYFSNGDGNTEPQGVPGLLATLLSGAYDQISQNLMWAWLSQGVSSLTIDGFFAPSIMALDFSIPPLDPHLGSQHFPGYHSVLRSRWGTPYEDAVSFLYGGVYSYQGHAHNDTGQVSAYLLGAPVSIDWNPNLYYPQVAGRFAHNSVVLDSELPNRRWSDDSPDLNLVSNWTGQSPEPTRILNTTTSTQSSSASAAWTKPDGTVWTRKVRLFDFDPDISVLHVMDSFSGSQGVADKTLTWNFMAYGPVETPSGSIQPTERFFSTGNARACGTYANEDCPSNGTVFPLTPGLHRFAFSGQEWTEHPTKGVDWSVYVRNRQIQSFMLGNWSHNQQSTAGLYNAVNSDSTFSKFREYQHILRVHGNEGFDTTIVARKKGSADPTVRVARCGIEVLAAGRLCFDDGHAEYEDRRGSRILATYDGSRQSAFGITITGGLVECKESERDLTCRLTGGATAARLELPPGYLPIQPTPFDVSGKAILSYGIGSTAFSFLKHGPRQGITRVTAPSGTDDQRLIVRYLSNDLVMVVPAGRSVILKGPRGNYAAFWADDKGSPSSSVNLSLE